MKTTFEQTENKYTDIVVEGYKDPITFRAGYPALAFQKLFDFLVLIPRKEKANLTIHVKRGTVGNFVNTSNK